MNRARELFAISLLALAGPAHAIERVHADLPLFSGQELQPVHFWTNDSFGCSSRVAFGDWQFKAADDPEGNRTEWMRLRNYGVFHCALIETWNADRTELGNAGSKYSWFVRLGEINRGGTKLELWALQSGPRPGSDYVLLARPLERGLIKSFEVLPVICPPAFERRGKPLDTWRVDYCEIDSAEELRGFARSMARRPRVGTLIWVGNAPEAGKDE